MKHENKIISVSYHICVWAEIIADLRKYILWNQQYLHNYTESTFARK